MDEDEWGGLFRRLSSAGLMPARGMQQRLLELDDPDTVLKSAKRLGMNGILNDEEKIQGVTVKYNDVMGEMGLEIDQEEEEIDEDFVRNIIRFGMIWELVCAILAFAGGALLMMRQNYNMVLIGCSAAIVGLGGLLLSTLLGAIALYLTFQSRPEFGIAEQDESW